MPKTVDPLLDPSRGEKLIKAAKSDAVSFAFSIGTTPDASALAVDKTKAGKALVELCKKESGGKKAAYGTVRIDGSTAVFTCERNDISQLSKAVLAYFKNHKISLKVELAAEGADEGADETDESEADEASPDRGKGGQTDEGSRQTRSGREEPDADEDEAEDEEADEDIPEGRIFDPEIIVPLIRKAKKRSRPFAFGVGPDRNLLAMHPKTEGVKLAKKVREEGAKKGVWGTVQLDGSVAVFTCEREPFAGVKKGLKRWFKDQRLSIKFRVQGPEGDYDDPEDTEDDAPAVNPDIERMRAQLENAQPRLQAVLEQAPGRKADIDRELAAFEAAANDGDAAAAREALLALAALAKPATNPAIDTLRAQFERARPQIARQLEDAGRQADFEREVAAFEAAATQGDAKEARAALDRLAAAAREVGAGMAGGLVALQKSRLAWDGLRKNVQAQLQELEKSILDAVRAHNADDTADDTFDEADVQVGVGQLYRILDRLDNRLIDKLDQALNAEGEQRQALHAEAAVIVKEYQGFVDGDPLLAEVDQNGFFKTTIKGDALAALGELARNL